MPQRTADLGRTIVTPMDSTPDDGRMTSPVDVARCEAFRDGSAEARLARLRRDAPVSYCRDSRFGPYWSITRHADIEEIERDTATFSSAHALGGIAIGGEPGAPDFFPMFIAMDPPDHAARRRAVLPAFGPNRLRRLAVRIREEVASVLDALPVKETFDWVDRVSIEITAMTLATLLDFPQSERRQLVRWSDIMSASPGGTVALPLEQKLAEMEQCFARLSLLWEARKAAPPADDLISLLAHGEETCSMSPQEFRGTMMLLIVAGNDTTRNSITGSLLALSRAPAEYARLLAAPKLLDTMVPEVMRWQTPIAHMRRTATRDVLFRGQPIHKGDKVVLWYLSANRDEAVFDNPSAFVLDRPNARRHLAFGHGIHHCLGARTAELQIRILWEEMLTRFSSFEADVPVFTSSTFINGYDALPVRVASR